MRRIVAVSRMAAAAFALWIAAPSAAQVQARDSKREVAKQVLGVWRTESGNLDVEIAPCGGTMLCGTVVKVLANRSMAEPGQQSADTKPVIGLKIMYDFTRAGPDELQGKIYNRENGKTYDCLLSLQSPNELIVRSYVGLPLIGKTQIWRRTAASGSAK